MCSTLASIAFSFLLLYNDVYDACKLRRPFSTYEECSSKFVIMR